MLKSHSIMWVKNVYNLCVHHSTTCARLYTAFKPSNHKPTTASVQPTVYTRFITSFTPSLYTGIFSHLTPFKYYLSPLSTAPIISKTN